MSETYTLARSHGATLLTLLKCVGFFFTRVRFMHTAMRRRCVDAHYDTLTRFQTVLLLPTLLCYNLDVKEAPLCFLSFRFLCMYNPCVPSRVSRPLKIPLLSVIHFFQCFIYFLKNVYLFILNQ